MNSDFWLYVPEGAKYEKLDEDGKKVNMGCWYTNLDLKKRHDGLWHIGDKFDQSKAHKYYEGFEENYPKYDNYDAIDVSKVQDIPIDYTGIMGVPITFVDKFNPKEFKILGLSQKEGLGLQSTVDYSEYKEVRQNGKFTGASGKKTNGNPVLKGKPKKGNFYINKEGRTVFSLYGRIFVQNLHPIKRSDDTGY